MRLYIFNLLLYVYFAYQFHYLRLICILCPFSPFLAMPGWLSLLSSRLWPMVHEFEPHIGLCADSSEPGACFRSVSPSLSAPPLLALCISLSLFLSHYINEISQYIKKFIYFVPFVIGSLWVFFFLSYWSFPHTLDTNTLCNIWLTNT